MADTPAPAPDANASAPAPKPRARSLQDQAKAAYITDSLLILNAALSLPAAEAAQLAARGYDAAAIQAGAGLQDKAQKAFNRQLPAIGADRRQTELHHAAITRAREDYATYRGIARPSFPVQSDRVALGLTGDVPEDLGKFVTSAKAAYAAGRTAPYTGKLTLRGYPPAALETLSGALDNLTEPDLGADAPPPPASGEDDPNDPEVMEAIQAAYDALRAWMKEFKGVARTVFRRHTKVLGDLHL